MNSKAKLSSQTLNQELHAVAILTQDYCVLYSNKSFDILFHFIQGRNQHRICKTLADLQVELRPSQHVSSPQEITIPGSNQKHQICVHFLDKLKNGECHYLIQVKNGNLEYENSLFKGINPHITKNEIQVEQLLPEFSKLIGKHVKFKWALIIAQRAAKSDMPILITGDSGTGKEILARAIHQSSFRNSKPLVDVNCAAIPDTLIESELFGYEKGAFTGASTEGRGGYFDQAHEGTLFLDEIGDSSLKTQSKLLRVLENGSFKRVGGNKNITVNVRIISATNQDLTALVVKKDFREDLFYRLNATTIYIPTLKERQEDIPLLIEHFVTSFPSPEKRDLKFSQSAMDILLHYHWPGNVRELKSVVNYAANMSRGSIIPPSSLPSYLFTKVATSDTYDIPTSALLNNKTYNLIKIVQLFEKNLINDVLTTSISKNAAINTLGISRRAFYLKINKYNLK